MSNPEDLVQKALRLQQLLKELIEALQKAFETEDYEDFENVAREYRETKKEIKLAFMEKPALTLPDIGNAEARRVVAKS